MKQFLNFSKNPASILGKIENVARAISLLVLILDTVRFFQNGLQKFNDESKREESSATGAPVAGVSSAAAE